MASSTARRRAAHGEGAEQKRNGGAPSDRFGIAHPDRSAAHGVTAR